jgi:ABC-type lipoprotein export system ATPase subunit
LSTIQIQNLTKHFHKNKIQVTVLKDICISFKQDTSYAIMGDSGSGKTTLMHILAGLEKQTSGSITAHSSSSFACMFQKPYLQNELSILENVLLCKIISGTVSTSDYKNAQSALNGLNIHNMHQKCATLSGGQQQKVAFLRALFACPSFLLADEPTTFLDSASSTELLDLMFTTHKENNMGLIIITHDEKVAQRADEVYELQHGQLFKKDF